MFADTQFMSAADKASFMRAWLKFQRGGFKRSQFTKAIYYHLYQHCGFIAHYNIDGFYAARFDDIAGRIATLRQLRNEGRGYRGHADFNDVNLALAETINVGEAEREGKQRRIEFLQELVTNAQDELAMLANTY